MMQIVGTLKTEFQLWKKKCPSQKVLREPVLGSVTAWGFFCNSRSNGVGAAPAGPCLHALPVAGSYSYCSRLGWAGHERPGHQLHLPFHSNREAGGWQHRASDAGLVRLSLPYKTNPQLRGSSHLGFRRGLAQTCLRWCSGSPTRTHPNSATYQWL